MSTRTEVVRNVPFTIVKKKAVDAADTGEHLSTT